MTNKYYNIHKVEALKSFFNICLLRCFAYNIVHCCPSNFYCINQINRIIMYIIQKMFSKKLKISMHEMNDHCNIIVLL